MDKFQLKIKAADLRKKIENCYTQFLFDPNIKEYKEELDKLQKQCIHQYENGHCIWCGKEEE